MSQPPGPVVGHEFPDAIVLDDYLPESGVEAGRAVDTMSWLCRRCIEREIPLSNRPRVVLWTSVAPDLAYTFCVLGGLQVQDKRHGGGVDLPVDRIWAALAGRRWQPEPFPIGLEAERHRAPLPWIEAGWPLKKVVEVLAHQGVTLDTIETTRESIRDLPRTPRAGDTYPSNTAMVPAAAKLNGWVWVPLRWHERIPPGAPLPLVIDSDAHRGGSRPRGRCRLGPPGEARAAGAKLLPADHRVAVLVRSERSGVVRAAV